MTHERYEENVGPYLLGALPELERQSFERHVERCDDCRSAVEGLRPAAAALLRAATPLAPPPHVKAALMEVVEREAQASADGRASEQAAVPRRARTRREQLMKALRPALRRRPVVAWASAAVLVAVGAAGGFVLAEELSDAGAQRLTAQVDETRLPRASAQLVVADGGGTAVLHANAMPSLDGGSVYQVWLQRDGEIVPQSLFQVGPDGRGAGVVTDGIEGADAVMLTREPAGGSQTPTEPPVLTVEL